MVQSSRISPAARLPQDVSGSSDRSGSLGKLDRPTWRHGSSSFRLRLRLRLRGGGHLKFAGCALRITLAAVGMKLFLGGRRFWRAASGAKQHVSLDGNKSSSRTCILIQERTRKENPGGKRQREGEGEGEGEEKERDQSQLLGRSFADNCSVIHQLIGHLNAPSNALSKAYSKAHPRPTLRG